MRADDLLDTLGELEAAGANSAHRLHETAPIVGVKS